MMRISLLAAMAGLACAGSAFAATENIPYSLKGIPDGQGPSAPLIEDPKGVLYGTTGGGGSAEEGTVFSLTPPASGTTGWTEKVIYSFKGGSDGDEPLGSLVLGADGVLYGTTSAGGTVGRGYGTVFSLTP